MSHSDVYVTICAVDVIPTCEECDGPLPVDYGYGYAAICGVCKKQQLREEQIESEEE